MKSWMLRIGAVLVLMACSALPGARLEAQEEDTTEAKQEQAQYEEAAQREAEIFTKLRNSFIAAYDAGNAAGVASTFAMNGTLMLPDGRHITGREAIHQAYHEVFEGWESQSLEVQQAGMHLSGDHAFSHGSYTVTAQPAGGAQGQVSIEGHYANHIQKQSDGTWKIVWHIVTGPDPTN